MRLGAAGDTTFWPAPRVCVSLLPFSATASEPPSPLRAALRSPLPPVPPSPSLTGLTGGGVAGRPPRRRGVAAPAASFLSHVVWAGGMVGAFLVVGRHCVERGGGGVRLSANNVPALRLPAGALHMKSTCCYPVGAALQRCLSIDACCFSFCVAREPTALSFFSSLSTSLGLLPVRPRFSRRYPEIKVCTDCCSPYRIFTGRSSAVARGDEVSMHLRIVVIEC